MEKREGPRKGEGEREREEKWGMERKSCECHRMKAAGKLNLMNVGYKICIFERGARGRKYSCSNSILYSLCVYMKIKKEKNIMPLFSCAFYVSPAPKNL